MNIIDKIPKSIIIISESGIYTSEDMKKLYDKGCNGVLIGESIITSHDPYEKIIVDKNGTNSIEWGAFGVPETFIIYNNKIIKKYIGPLNQEYFLEIQNLIK